MLFLVSMYLDAPYMYNVGFLQSSELDITRADKTYKALLSTSGASRVSRVHIRQASSLQPLNVKCPTVNDKSQPSRKEVHSHWSTADFSVLLFIVLGMSHESDFSELAVHLALFHLWCVYCMNETGCNSSICVTVGPLAFLSKFTILQIIHVCCNYRINVNIIVHF